jgi:hypothetical protein
MRSELLEQTEISKFSPSLKCIPLIAIAARLKNGNIYLSWWWLSHLSKKRSSSQPIIPTMVESA